MKWIFGCLAIFLLVAPAQAGEDPFVAIVGNDCVNGVLNSITGTCVGGVADPFYFSPKHTQFMYNQGLLAVNVCDPANATLLPAYKGSLTRFPASAEAGCEQFHAQTPLIQHEICFEGLPFTNVVGPGGALTQATSPTDHAKVTAGNAGFFEWFIRLPKKPTSEINIVLECAVLKPNGTGFFPLGDAIEFCAAETGERTGDQCSMIDVDPGNNPLVISALPKLTAIAYAGPFNVGNFTSFHLTAFKNPSSYTLAFDPVTGAMSNNTNSQILDGSTAARVLLKACMDKTIVAKRPVTGQMNAFVPAETEYDLEAGDLIFIRLDIPRQNTVDIYCGPQSARLAGVGEFPF